jgi:hypothetical protein
MKFQFLSIWCSAHRAIRDKVCDPRNKEDRDKHTNTHTHIHTQREREREREKYRDRDRERTLKKRPSLS